MVKRFKKSIGLNLKNAAAREVFYRMVKVGDVVMEGFRPGVTKRLGVDYETLTKLNPRIIYCSLSGYGQDGPYRDLVGHDINYVALSGLQSLLGSMPPLNLIGDLSSGSLFSVIAIITALFSREKTGKGQYLDVSTFDGIVSLASWFTKISEEELKVYDGAPYYYLYKCGDGKHISIGCMEEQFWANLCRTMGREDFIPLQKDEGRWQEIIAAFEDTFSSKTRDEWFDILMQADVCVAPVYSVEEMLSDAHVTHRALVNDVDHPQLGTVRQIGSPIKFSETSGQIWGNAPTAYEHTDEILLGLDYTQDEINTMRRNGAVI
jgi:crotonobetainyl-CoA:carnitine CoA-transferase CaiB-like acyl-CoA transferase